MDDTLKRFVEERFWKNVREARANGFDLLCAVCGIGIHDDSDTHEPWCPQSGEEGGGFATVRAAIDALVEGGWE